MFLSQDMYSTLQNMKRGAEFLLRGDKNVGVEIRRDDSGRKVREINCRSLPPLMRRGLIDFSCEVRDMTRYYKVALTEKGRDACIMQKK